MPFKFTPKVCEIHDTIAIRFGAVTEETGGSKYLPPPPPPTPPKYG